MWWSHSHIRKRASMAAMEVPLESERDDYITHDYDMGDLERESTMDENAAVEGPSTKTSTFSCCPTVQLCLIYVDGKDVIFFDLLPPASFDSAFNGIVILPPIQQLVSDHRFNGVLNGLHVQVRGRKHGCVAIYAATDNKPSKVRWQKLRFSGRVAESVRAIFNSVFWDAGGSVSALHRHGFARHDESGQTVFAALLKLTVQNNYIPISGTRDGAQGHFRAAAKTTTISCPPETTMLQRQGHFEDL
ncbi:unnamed protein product [Fusarium graminearum]|uniref:Uncharacterized protein n=1 Tax=Gibberella zeae TaxID=5518 RepID=A0A9N8RKB9_GIBZA|nr:unnamed protein product [Fusarium graminearum]CAG1999022.1 unnamed protein product [Fusarium graminearum]